MALILTSLFIKNIYLIAALSFVKKKKNPIFSVESATIFTDESATYLIKFPIYLF